MIKTCFASLLATGAVLAGLSAPAFANETIKFTDTRFKPGTVVIRTGEKRLYFVTAPGEAIRYTIAVGKAGQGWHGVKHVAQMDVEPAWAAPDSLRKDKSVPATVIPGGAPNNPMGARAIGLGPEKEYGIHGTNRPDSIGTAASSGCFRMHNSDVIDLYSRVSLGTPVVVMP
jgi:lipoprotein-anchoring transpeptidase ErfK/SrfK